MITHKPKDSVKSGVGSVWPRLHRSPILSRTVGMGIYSALAALLFTGTVSAQEIERYQKVLIQTDDIHRLETLPSFDAHTLYPDTNGVELILSESDVQTLRTTGYPVQCLIEDVQKFYAERAATSLGNPGTPFRKSSDESVPEHFELGSAIGYYTPQELSLQLLRMRLLFPHLTSEPYSIGTSVEGRVILAMRISARPDSEDVPEAFFNGVHHAREPIGMMSLVYSMWHMLEAYGKDAEITNLLDNRAIWFVPLVNPDGYQYNLTYFPEGGGTWRKNRGGVDNQGIDLNRNYSTEDQWGPADNPGLIDPASGNYRGVVPFSEPETRAIRDFVLGRKFRAGINYHSFGAVLIYHHIGEEPSLADTSWYCRSARELTRGNGYGYGRGEEAIGYRAYGTAEEWMFLQQTTPRSLFGWAPEVGTREDGFWPAPDRIVPLCKQSLDMTLRAAWMAGAFPQVTAWETDSRHSSGGNVVIARITNVGLQPMTETGSIAIAGYDDSRQQFSPLAPGESAQVSLELPSEFLTRQENRSKIDLRTTYKDLQWERPVDVMNHQHTEAFSDQFEQSLGSWKNDLWGIETSAEHGRVLSDSPYEKYFESDIPNRLELAAPVSLEQFDAAELRFDALSLTRAVHHQLIVEAQRPGEQNWHPLSCEYMQSSVDTNSSFLNQLRGANRLWETYSIPLDEFAGESVLIRFTQEAPITGSSGPLFDGTQIDNVRIIGALKIPTSTPTEQNGQRAGLAWPNPTTDRIFVNVPGATDSIHVRIVDALGREVLSQTGSNGLWLNIQHIPSGPYFLSVTSREFVASEKIIRR